MYLRATNIIPASRYLMLSLALISLCACVSSPSRDSYKDKYSATSKATRTSAHGKPTPYVPDESISEEEELREALYRQHDFWAGTPYRYGGMDYDGVDCSGLVLRAFHEEFGLMLPRTTRGQVKIGKKVHRGALLPGDLVFFKTGRGGRHVGIVLQDTQFMHASSSRGVVISDLRNPYWAGHYWQARRVPGLR